MSAGNQTNEQMEATSRVSDITRVHSMDENQKVFDTPHRETHLAPLPVTLERITKLSLPEPVSKYINRGQAWVQKNA
jgi:hypothetical protein